MPGDPPENEQNPYIQGGLLAPLGGPKFFKYFFHMVITARPRDTRILVPEKNRAAQNRAS